MKSNFPPALPRKLRPAALLREQTGAALLVSLIFTVVMSMLGIIAMQTSTMNERMAANSRDRNLAFQAAESAIADAILDISGIGNSRTLLIDGMTGANATCTNGLCCVPHASGLTCIDPTTPVYSAFSMSATPSIAYGAYTGSPALSAVFRQPRYLIEPFEVENGELRYYRITARGYGANQNNQVTLERIFKPG